MQSRVRPPLWGNFITHADEDLLALGLLMRGGLHTLAFYHGVQAIEKYLKALVLSILDPAGAKETSLTQRWLKTHDLEILANECKDAFPFYGESGVLDNLKRFTEFDKVGRTSVDQVLGNGFCSDDISIIGDLCKHLRCDLPITRDNYKLAGMEVREICQAIGRAEISHGNITAMKLLRHYVASCHRLIRL